MKRTASPTKAPTKSPTAVVAYTPGVCGLTTATVSSAANTCLAYSSIKTDFTNLVASTALPSSIYGIVLRLIFHDAGEYDQTQSDLLGPDGCVGVTDDSIGLYEATSLVNTVLEPIWQKYCDKISRGDFWALFAKLVVEKADPTATIRIPFQWGRRSATECTVGALHRLPSAGLGIPEITRVFVTQMGLTLHDASKGVQ